MIQPRRTRLRAFGESIRHSSLGTSDILLSPGLAVPAGSPVPTAVPEATRSFVRNISFGNVVTSAAGGERLLTASLAGGLSTEAIRGLSLSSFKKEVMELSDASLSEGFGARSLRTREFGSTAASEATDLSKNRTAVKEVKDMTAKVTAQDEAYAVDVR